jgi:hypothetical protein
LPFHPAAPDGTLGKPRPAPCDLVLLPDAGFVGEPDLYVGRRDALLLCDFVQTGGETLWDGPPLTSRRYSGGGNLEGEDR